MASSHGVWELWDPQNWWFWAKMACLRSTIPYLLRIPETPTFPLGAGLGWCQCVENEGLQGLPRMGRVSPNGGEVDPPKVGSFVFLVQPPTTLLKHVCPNLAPVESYRSTKSGFLRWQSGDNRFRRLAATKVSAMTVHFKKNNPFNIS